VLVLGFHIGMFDHNTIRMLTSFRSVSLAFDRHFRQATSDSFKGAIVMIIHAIFFIYYYQKSIILDC
jgi:hypothetical protein